MAPGEREERAGMAESGEIQAIGLMSGTSLDGIDAALLTTDGRDLAHPGGWLSRPYDDATRALLRRALGGEAVTQAERVMTDAHAEALAALLDAAGLTPADIGVVGFHGHTLWHRPERGESCQIGDGARLAALCGIDVVDDFRSADMAAGGEGAPLAPLYHRVLAQGLARPLCVLNVGGVANVTWLGEGDELVAFDTGPGGALLDDWMRATTGERFDEDGRLARLGRVDEAALARLLDDPWFERPPPKSLDRHSFDPIGLAGLAPEDGAATLVALTARAVAAARSHFPAAPARWLVCGGGRHNGALMAALAEGLDGADIAPVEAVGWQGDALEAQAFAYLAVRSLRGLPLSLPRSTGAREAVTGGRLHPAPEGGAG